MPDDVHARVVQAFARLFGRVMPFWYALTALLTLVLVLMHRQNALLIASAVLWFFAIVYTVIFPVPVNNRVTKWDLLRLPATWKMERSKWDRYHRARVVILLAALVCLVFGA